MNNRKVTITRERLEWLSQISGRDDIEDVDGGEIRELASRELAAMDSKPVIADCDPEVFGKGVSVCLISIPKETAEVICKNITAATGCKVDWHYFGGRVHIKALPPSLQTAPEREQVRNEHAEWSQTTFGNVGPVGPLKHLSKEALEAAAEPDDLSEWADMQFLMWDAQRRAGITDEQITQAMIEKLAVNKQRKWPEPKDGEPRLHIKQGADDHPRASHAIDDVIAERQVTIEPFRSFVTDADLAALHRFAECCDDPESSGHDLENEQVLRLEAIGALRRFGCVHFITGFGDVLISITSDIRVEDDQ